MVNHKYLLRNNAGKRFTSYVHYSMKTIKEHKISKIVLYVENYMYVG